VWSWDITYLPTIVRGVWLYLFLVDDVWSRKVVAWDVAEREDPTIAADLVAGPASASGSARAASSP
jgi:transposase InsO family protein